MTKVRIKQSIFVVAIFAILVSTGAILYMRAYSGEADITRQQAVQAASATYEGLAGQSSQEGTTESGLGFYSPLSQLHRMIYEPDVRFAKVYPVFSRFDSGVVLGLDTDGVLWLLEDSPNMYVSRLLAGDGEYNFPIKIMDNVSSFIVGCHGTAPLHDDFWMPIISYPYPFTIKPNIRIFIITNDNELWAAGHNIDGMLGDGTTYARSTPIRILENIASVYEGAFSVFALTIGGDVYSWQAKYEWGNNGSRRGGREIIYLPVTPDHILTNVYSLYVRSTNTWVITNDRDLYRARGGDGYFQHMFANVKEFRDSSALINVLTLDGYLYMWVHEFTSHLPSVPRTPTRVMDNVARIQNTRLGLTGTSMAIDRDGRLWRDIGFENNRNLEYTISGREPAPILREPEMILENAEVVKSALGSFFAITTNGELYAWGDNGGALGIGTSLTQNYPVRVMEQVASFYPFWKGYVHATHTWTFAITENGELYGWGRSWTHNQNEFDTRYSPVRLMDSVVSVHFSHDFRILFLRTDNSVWELQADGWHKIDCAYIFHDAPSIMLPEGLPALSPPGPVPLAPPGTAKLPPGISIGARSPLSLSEGGNGVRMGEFSSISAAITSEGRLFWLSRVGGIINDPPPIEPILALENVISVATGREHLLAVTQDNRLFAWGHNLGGVIGDSSIPIANYVFSWGREPREGINAPTAFYPIRIMDDVKYVHVSIFAPFFVSDRGSLQDRWVTSNRHDTSFAITLNGDLFAWGGNNFGQIGDGTTDSRNYPFLVMDNVAYLTSSSAGSVFAITHTGDLYAWGNNTVGEPQLTPVRVMQNVAHVSASGTHTLAITQNGDLWAWGTNESGQLGNNTTQDESAPIFVKSDVISATAGLRTSFAITSDDTLWGFGASELVNSTARGGQLYPRPIMENVAFVSVTYTHTAAITNDGNLWRLGFAHQWILPDQWFDEPVWVMSNVVYVATAAHNSVALMADGSLWRWQESFLYRSVSPTRTHDSIMLP